MNFTELANNRYSCRKLTDIKLTDEQLEKIVEAAIAAPTAVNKQPYRLFLIDSEEGRENIKKVTPFSFGAGTFLIVASKEDEAWVREFDKKNFADVDAAIVATHIMLEIEDLGLSTTWVGHFNEPELKEIYPELKDLNLIAIFPIGYKKEEAKPAHLHFKRKSKEEVLKRI